MDTTDRPDKTLPAKRSVPTARVAVPEFAEPAAHAGASRDFSFRLVWRAFRRHWWQALLLWAVGSVGLVALAYYRIKPTYDASSQIKIENTSYSILTDKNIFTPVDFGQYMETLVSNITSPTVIGTALTMNPRLADLPMLRGSSEPEMIIRKSLRVGIVPRTQLIQVSLSSKNPGEAAEIVNAVVKTFVKLAEDLYDASTQEQIKRLKGERDKQELEVKRQRTLIEGLTKTIDVAALDRAKDRNVASLETYRQLQEERTRVEIMRIQAEGKLNQLRNEKLAPVQPRDDGQLRDAITQLFYEDPQVAELQREREKAEARLAEARRLTRIPTDPSMVRAADQKAALDKKIDELWKRLEPRLRWQLTSTPVDQSHERMILEAESNLSALKIQEEALANRLDTVRIENRAAESEALQLEFMRQDLVSANNVLERVQSALDQLEFDARSPVARVELNFEATPSILPDGNLRTQVMIAGPVVFGLFILVSLLMLERWGARVGDPDELSSRMKLKVIGVVPPLPQIRPQIAQGEGATALAATSDMKAQRQLDEFVQSLDHLRVALCARRDPWGRDRHCVLVTSACGSEGKTTLAAQLAERCVNAGQMTLLIDADLRNPTLSRMLDAQDNPGLINVLRGEVMAEDVVMVIGDAGGFHLIPAGNPRMDPSRLLASDRLAKLLAQARESFDMIIVDVPPVLPVPDALTIGKLTDGAVLVVRYDTSRFPLVERAHSRLTHVGVPILGAVLNGVRSMESSYGGYYAYGSYGSTYYGSEESAAASSGKGSSSGSRDD
ncbi:MAG: GumC family protein [Isosphaeraceae bacterium]